MSRWKYPENCSVCGELTGKGRAKGMCESCYRKWYSRTHPEQKRKDGKTYYRKHAKEFCQKITEKRRALRRRIVAALGGKCACCGETQYEFLTIDHLDNTGAAHRRKIGWQHKIYREIEREGYPKDKYQILCYNCNCAKGVWGYCPHSPSPSETSPNMS